MENDKGNRIFYRYLELLSQEHEQDADRDWGMIHILGGMQRLNDGSTADPAYESDWDDAVSQCADPADAYQIGIQFLNICPIFLTLDVLKLLRSRLVSVWQPRNI